MNFYNRSTNRRAWYDHKNEKIHETCFHVHRKRQNHATALPFPHFAAARFATAKRGEKAVLVPLSEHSPVKRGGFSVKRK